MVTEMPTGVFRYRPLRRWFQQEPLLILQIEIRVKGYKPDCHGTGQNLDYKVFRDARVEDLILIQDAMEGVTQSG